MSDKAFIDVFLQHKQVIPPRQAINALRSEDALYDCKDI